MADSNCLFGFNTMVNCQVQCNNAITTLFGSQCIVVYTCLSEHITCVPSIGVAYSVIQVFNCTIVNGQVQGNDAIAAGCRWDGIHIVSSHCVFLLMPCISIASYYGLLCRWYRRQYSQLQGNDAIAAVDIGQSLCHHYAVIVYITFPFVSLAVANSIHECDRSMLWPYGQVQYRYAIATMNAMQGITAVSSSSIFNTKPCIFLTLADRHIVYSIWNWRQNRQVQS